MQILTHLKWNYVFDITLFVRKFLYIFAGLVTWTACESPTSSRVSLLHGKWVDEGGVTLTIHPDGSAVIAFSEEPLGLLATWRIMGDGNVLYIMVDGLPIYAGTYKVTKTKLQICQCDIDDHALDDNSSVVQTWYRKG